MLDVIDVLGLLPFLSFHFLPSRYRCLGIKLLIATALIFYNLCFSGSRFFSVSSIDFRVIGPAMLEHAIDDTKDFVHTQSYGRLWLHATLDMMLIDTADMRV